MNLMRTALEPFKYSPGISMQAATTSQSVPGNYPTKSPPETGRAFY